MLMGTTFLRGSVFRSSNFLGSAATLFSGLISPDTGAAATALTSGTLAGLLTPFVSLLVRLDLPPDFALAIFGYSLHLPKVRNELSCSANHIHFAHSFYEDIKSFGCRVNVSIT